MLRSSKQNKPPCILVHMKSLLDLVQYIFKTTHLNNITKTRPISEGCYDLWRDGDGGGVGGEEREAPCESFDALFEISSRQEGFGAGDGGGQLLGEVRNLLLSGGCLGAGLLQLLLQLLHGDPAWEWLTDCWTDRYGKGDQATIFLGIALILS